MKGLTGLERVREAAAELNSAERRVATARRTRDRRIMQALAERKRDADRPTPRWTQGEVAEAAGLKEGAVRSIARKR